MTNDAAMLIVLDLAKHGVAYDSADPSEPAKQLSAIKQLESTPYVNWLLSERKNIESQTI